MMPFYPARLAGGELRPGEPTVVGEFSTVEAAVMRAASLCRRN